MTVKKAYTNYNTLFDNLRIQDTGEMVNWKEALTVHRPGKKITTITQLLKLPPNPSKRISKRFL